MIYANLRKVLHLLFTGNLSEILTIFVAIVVGLPSPLLPLHILWVNLITDILRHGADPRSRRHRDVMRRPPRTRGDAIVTWTFGARILGEGTLLAAGVSSA